ncbi:hypothetical protein K435DRAFT_229296 [Dendrothele bispora CBS 962.96]|uniref:Uncharacterized protein n=1 Tax=Dendrothele bispora (strain CBS 962.96) TaxID=1314807 RepID=A0A4S8MN38_DENBC|nr:hypothetical protein K435DRAFT_229296 [Dendrothele bispora CBS 962.96]
MPSENTRKTRRFSSVLDPLSQASRPTRSKPKSSGLNLASAIDSSVKIESEGTISKTKTVSESKSQKSQNATTISKSDILIAIKPIFVDWIVSRQKTHEFRKYLLSSNVERMWIYTSSPSQTLQYIAIISQGKKPGEIDSSDSGIGNDEFNQGVHGCSGPSGYAYEIKELYELHEPLKLKDMQRRYAVTFPQRFVYLPKKMQEDFVLEDLKRVF